MPENQKQGQKEEKDTQSSMPNDTKPADELPESSDRTKEQFEKLKESNKKLKEELDRAKEESKPQQPSVLESLRPRTEAPQAQVGNVSAGQFSHLDQSQVDQIQQNLVQKGEDGYEYVNTQVLLQQLKQANDRAKQAEEQARAAHEQVTRYNEDQQIRDAYAKFPQLNPNGDQYDPNFYDMVKGELTNQMMNGQKNLVKAAERVDSMINSYRQPPAQPEVEEVKQTQKQQINASGNAPSRFDQTEFTQLKQATMRGKRGALAERLKRSGY